MANENVVHMPKPSENVLSPRDLLVHIREWLNGHRQTHTQHFGGSDASGHPHGYAGVVIPDWDVRQRLDEIEASIQATAPTYIQVLKAQTQEMKDMPGEHIKVPRPGGGA